MGNTPHYTRTLELGRADAKNMTVPVVVSTEAPVDRGIYIEVLSHKPEHVDLSRAPLPLIESHDANKVNIGIVTDLRVQGGKLRGTAKFGKSARALELFQDIADGIVRGVSVGYQLLEEIATNGRQSTFKFLPYEVSVVAVPADTQAGFFRSKTMNDHIEVTDNAENDPHKQNRNRKDSDAERVREIVGIGEHYQQYVNQSDTSRAVRDGWSVDRFRNLIMDRMETRHTDISDNIYRDGSGREWSGMQRNARFGRMLMLQIDPAAAIRAGAGLEQEISQETARRVGFTSGAGGIWVPDDMLFRGFGRRDFNVGTSTEAGNLVATDLRTDQWADAFRAMTIAGQMGVRTLNDLTSNVDIPYKTAASTVGWVTEIGSASETAPTTDKVSLTPHRVSAYIEASKQSIVQGSLSVETMLRDDLLMGAFVEIDRVCISGAGTANEPTGIVNTSGIGTVVGGTDGASINWQHILDLEAACANSNANPGAMAGYAVNPKLRAAMKRTAKGTAILEAIWGDGPLSADGIGQLNGFRAGVSTLLRSNLTKGTSTTVCSELVFGADWSDAILGRFGAAEVLVDPYTLATTGQVRITLNQYVDFGVRRAASFAKMSDALTS